jgi:aryl-alcohol dehydrogenase-like predicted oxidoreductase
LLPARTIASTCFIEFLHNQGWSALQLPSAPLAPTIAPTQKKERTMEMHQFGRTPLNVTPIGLGLAALGRPGYINLGHAADLDRDYTVKGMEANAHTVLDAAWEAGIRYFDAARSYGKAEQFLASWLQSRSIPAHAVTVGSKWGYTYTADWQVDADVHEVKEHSLAVLQRQTGESVALLGTHLDLYQIHSATLSSGVLQNEAVLDELARLKAHNGWTIGLSLSGTGQAETLERALTIRRDGVLLFGAVQATWNVLARSAESALQAAADAGLGVIVKEAVANGRLTARNTMASFARSRAVLDSLAAKHATSIDAVALAAVLAQPWIGVALSGAATVEHVRSNVRALAVALDADDWAALDSLREAPDVYWQTRSALPWN